jgi:hypothetical protein
LIIVSFLIWALTSMALLEISWASKFPIDLGGHPL